MTDDLNELASLLTDNDPDKCLAAAEELSLLGSDAQLIAAEMVQAMGNGSEEVRELVAATLEELGPPADEQLAELTALLADARPDVGYWAATLLGRLGGAGKVAVVPLIDAVGNLSADMAVRQRAVWALGKIGRPAAEAIPLLEQISQNQENVRLSRLAATAIERINN